MSEFTADTVKLGDMFEEEYTWKLHNDMIGSVINVYKDGVCLRFNNMKEFQSVFVPYSRLKLPVFTSIKLREWSFACFGGMRAKDRVEDEHPVNGLKIEDIKIGARFALCPPFNIIASKKGEVIKINKEGAFLTFGKVKAIWYAPFSLLEKKIIPPTWKRLTNDDE